MSVVIRGYNDLRNSFFRVEMSPNYTDESSNHPLACKIIFSEDDSIRTSQTMFMSFPEFYSYILLLVQNDQHSWFTFNIPGFPQIDVGFDALQDESTQD